MKNKTLWNWLVNLVLWVGFLVAFFLELTGLEAHQWLGLALGALAGYHLALHWKWVQAVGARFFGKTSGQARSYYLVDAAILCGFFLMVSTGIAISSWLALANVSFWVNLHVSSSILTLLLVVAKLGLHWRMIVQAAQKYILAPLAPQPVHQVPASQARLTRRSFLTLMGIVGVAASAAITNVQANAPADATSSPTAAAPATGSVTASGSTGQTAAGATTTTSTNACMLRCNKGCSYPGRCRRYTDTNKNGKCDLGECV